jgi:glycosyltransferase involved in cell wall biosynthesis
VISDPQVTVLLCVWNGEPHLKAAVDSILAQTFHDFEFLIIDDASTDGTPKFLASLTDPRVRVVRNETNLGLTRSLNRGLKLARGELIARQDADDWSTPDRLELQLPFLRANPPVVAVGAQAQLIDGNGGDLGR